jgi:hypothetical protein
LENPTLMLRDLVQLLPPDLSSLVLYLAMAGVCAGVGLWLAGSRMSRGLITLSMVSAAAMIGLRLPGWMGWQVSGMAVAIALALAGGVLGFIGHRLWVGIGLGLTLGLWAMVACWLLLHGDYLPAWNELDLGAGASGIAQQLWEQLPEPLQKWWPIAGAAGFAAGLLLMMFWPRLTLVTLYSLVGVSMLVGWGTVAMQAGRPQWLERLPQQTWQQAALIGVMVVSGGAIQWILLPGRAGAKSPSRETRADDAGG